MSIIQYSDIFQVLLATNVCNTDVFSFMNYIKCTNRQRKINLNEYSIREIRDINIYGMVRACLGGYAFVCICVRAFVCICVRAYVCFVAFICERAQHCAYICVCVCIGASVRVYACVCMWCVSVFGG